MGHYNYSLSVNATNMVSTNCPIIIGEQVAVKVPLAPPIFFLLIKSTSFPDFINGKTMIISIDKILTFLQAFELVISMFTTAQSGLVVM